MLDRGGELTGVDLNALLEAYERQLIEDALAAARGHQRRAAALLGILPSTLNEKMKRLRIARPMADRALGLEGGEGALP